MARPTSAEKRVLGLFAKQPTAGQVKTRLAVGSSPEWAADVAGAFLRDTVDRLAGVEARRVLAFAPDDAEPFFADLVGDRFDLLPQQPGDLGQRMAAFFAAQLAGGAAAVVLLGTDSPTLPLAIVHEAFAQLATADVVLGPATDGGYYLLGCGPRLPPIFDGIQWGGARVLGDTIARLADRAWRVALLPPWYDVDTPQDWQMLCGHLAALARAGIDPQVPHTARLARTFLERGG